MKQILSLAVLLALFLLVNPVFSQKTAQRFTGPIRPNVCIGTNVNANVSVPVSKEVLRRMKSKSSRKTQFNVTYHNFPSNAMTAFQYALDIWSSILYTSVPVRIDAYWESGLPAGVLGSTSPTNFYNNVNGAYKFDAYYPIVLAEKISGHVLGSPLDPDIEIHLSSTMPWYYGTDGSTPFNKYDLVTVTLHEICHGLGFTGSFYVDAGRLGYYGDGSSNSPEIFDYFVTDFSGKHFVDTNHYINPSSTMGIGLTSLNNAFFDGIMTRKANSLNRVTLYSPNPWSSGSSIYHVGSIYSGDPLRTLMYYAIDLQEAVHDPGAMLTGMMGDLGWVHTWIRHDSLPDVETLSGPRTIIAQVESDTTLTPGSFYLYYSLNNSGSLDSIQMIADGSPNEYSAQITISSLGTSVSYYFSLKDIFGRVYMLPGDAPTNRFRFFVGKDTIPPSIQNQPAQFILNTEDSIMISANVHDNLAVDTVYVEYKHNDGASFFRGMVLDSASVYHAYLDLASFDLVPGDSLEYRIVAGDKSVAHNLSYLPELGFYVVPVVNPPVPTASYYTNFDSISYDFIVNGFNISTPSGFNSRCLNSDHPYASPQVNNGYFNYIAQLRVPVIINQSNAFLKFDEIALTEPNDSGYIFGTSGFYDYVIVEGSSDGGSSWKYFQSGWNCTLYPDWFYRFESNLDINNNSLATADNSLYRTHQINMLSSGDFKGGDTILIRFRLYSDPYVYGWGWAIDNLNIQDVAMLGVAEKIIPSSDLLIYPNPACDFLNLKCQFSTAPELIRVNFINMVGKLISTCSYNKPGNNFSKYISLEGMQQGVYLAEIFIDGYRIVKKFSIIR